MLNLDQEKYDYYRSCPRCGRDGAVVAIALGRLSSALMSNLGKTTTAAGWIANKICPVLSAFRRFASYITSFAASVVLGSKSVDL